MNWYYAENGQQTGPITHSQLEQLFQSGKITADTLVWREGLSDWMPYRQAMEGTPRPPAPEPPPPTAAENSAQPGEVVCAECGRLFPSGDTIRIGQASVCAECKPVFLQKLSEGARINTGELNYATILNRFAAVFLDGLILGAINIGTNAILGVFIAQATRHAGTDAKVPETFVIYQFLLMAFNLAVGLTYETVMIGKYGATLGKMACKIKVVTADGGQVTYARALGRYFAKMLSGAICAIGYIMAMFDDEKRALHDRLCDTRVINKQT